MFQWLLIAAQVFFVSFAYPASLHVILVADTLSDNGPAAIYEMEHVKQQLAQVANRSGLELKQQLFNGYQEAWKVRSAVEALQPEPEDCVVFYFIGHGYRTSQMRGPWPLLYFSREPAIIDLQDIVDQLIVKHPRFGLVVADCCNNVLDQMYTIDSHPVWARKKDLTKGYHRLFLESSGIVVISAARKGDYAYCDERGFGHLFSQSFWPAFLWEAGKNDPSWLGVLTTTCSLVSWIQFPYYEILVYSASS